MLNCLCYFTISSSRGFPFLFVRVFQSDQFSWLPFLWLEFPAFVAGLNAGWLKHHLWKAGWCSSLWARRFKMIQALGGHHFSFVCFSIEPLRSYRWWIVLNADSSGLRHPQLMLALSLLQPEKNDRFWPHANRFLLNARLYHWSLSSATSGLQLSPRSSSGPIISFIVVINPAIFTTVASITIVTYCNHCGVILCTSSAIISRWESPTEVTNYMVRRS